MDSKQYQAAGGIVVRGQTVLLLSKWALNEMVLPKGHIEPGETARETALRETREETGYQHLRILADLGTRRADFIHADTHVIRDETYFVMELLDDTRATATDYDDAEHDRQTFELHWVPLATAAEQMTFEPARTFVRAAAAWIQQRG